MANLALRPFNETRIRPKAPTDNPKGGGGGARYASTRFMVTTAIAIATRCTRYTHSNPLAWMATAITSGFGCHGWASIATNTATKAQLAHCLDKPLRMRAVKSRRYPVKMAYGTMKADRGVVEGSTGYPGLYPCPERQCPTARATTNHRPKLLKCVRNAIFSGARKG